MIPAFPCRDAAFSQTMLQKGMLQKRLLQKELSQKKLSQDRSQTSPPPPPNHNLTHGTPTTTTPKENKRPLSLTLFTCIKTFFFLFFCCCCRKCGKKNANSTSSALDFAQTKKSSSSLTLSLLTKEIIKKKPSTLLVVMDQSTGPPGQILSDSDLHRLKGQSPEKWETWQKVPPLNTRLLFPFSVFHTIKGKKSSEDLLQWLKTFESFQFYALLCSKEDGVHEKIVDILPSPAPLPKEQKKHNSSSLEQLHVPHLCFRKEASELLKKPSSFLCVQIPKEVAFQFSHLPLHLTPQILKDFFNLSPKPIAFEQIGKEELDRKEKWTQAIETDILDTFFIISLESHGSIEAIHKVPPLDLTLKSTPSQDRAKYGQTKYSQQRFSQEKCTVSLPFSTIPQKMHSKTFNEFLTELYQKGGDALFYLHGDPSLISETKLNDLLGKPAYSPTVLEDLSRYFQIREIRTKNNWEEQEKKGPSTTFWYDALCFATNQVLFHFGSNQNEFLLLSVGPEMKEGKVIPVFKMWQKIPYGEFIKNISIIPKSISPWIPTLLTKEALPHVIKAIPSHQRKSEGWMLVQSTSPILPPPYDERFPPTLHAISEWTELKKIENVSIFSLIEDRKHRIPTRSQVLKEIQKEKDPKYTYTFLKIDENTKSILASYVYSNFT